MKIAFNYLRQNYILVIVLLLGVYFLKPALQGQMGFFRYLQVQAQIEESNQKLAELTMERERLENLTHRLSNDFLDIDLLDEQARKRLGLVRESEIIIR